MDIDFVIPWVDGDDPHWISQRNQYASGSETSDPCRFRDWDILRYWFRAVENHAPWVRRIFFVTCGQVPSWLNTHHPKLQLVNHLDYIPQEYLPTFSSHTIELNLHRIPGLSEHFVYFNDDMFLNGPVVPEDFFLHGLPKDCAALDSPAPGTDVYACAQRNVIRCLNKHFDKQQTIKENPKLWFSPLYAKYAAKNLLFARGSEFAGIKNFHIPSSLCKSTFERVWELAPQVLDETCRNRFRYRQDVNQYIMGYYQLCTGNFLPRRADFGKCYRIELDQQKIRQDIRSGTHKVICINDHPGITDFTEQKALLISLFERRYPKKSSFEL